MTPISRADSPQPPDLQSHLDQFHAELAKAVDDFRSRLDTPKADPTVRTYTYAAYYGLSIGVDPKIAEDFIRRAMARQDMNPASPDFGNVPWQMFANDMHDANSIEFTFASIGPILLGYGDKLSPEFKKEMIPHVAGAIAAIYRHNVPVSYTNIYLMKTENLLLLGQAINDQKAIAAGRDQLNNWLSYTRTHGIHEYASPTYASVQLNCALYAYRHTSLPDVRAKLKTALDYLWADATANYFPPTGMMSGAHSRDYDFLRATGPIDRFYWLEGLTDRTPLDTLFSDSYGAYVNAVEHGYKPSQQILALAHQPTRIVKNLWDDVPGADRYTYVTPDFAIGSTSAPGGPQTRLIAVDLGDSRPYVPVSICVSGDTFDSPYGKVRRLDRSGHEKPVRLHANIASVQDHGSILALFDMSPDLHNTPAESVTTDVVLPLHVDRMTLDGQLVNFPAPALAAEDATLAKKKVNAAEWKNWSMPANENSVLTLRYGHAAVAIKIFAADGIDNQTPTFALKCDGAEWGAARLVAYHYRGSQQIFKQKPVRAGVIILAAHCETDADADALAQTLDHTKIHQSNAEDTWTTEASIPGNEPRMLEAALNFKTGTPTIRKVNNQPYVPAPFSVNNQDLSAAIFATGM